MRRGGITSCTGRGKDSVSFYSFSIRVIPSHLMTGQCLGHSVLFSEAIIKKLKMRHRLAQCIERASLVQRLCPRCGGSRIKSRPGALCFMSLPLFLSCCFLSISCCSINNKADKRPPQKNFLLFDICFPNTKIVVEIQVDEQLV